MEGALDFTAEVEVKNAMGEDVTIQVHLYEESNTEQGRVGYLSLGDRDGPTLNDADELLREKMRSFR